MKQKALIVIDLQNGVHSETAPLFKLEEVIKGVNARIRYYRDHSLPIIFVQHTDSDLPRHSKAWELFETLDAVNTDLYIEKTHANAFFQTSLTEQLQQLHVTHLEICGAQVEYCVDTTIRMAHGLGYTLFMKKGLATTANNFLLGAETIIKHHENLWDKRFLTFI